MQSPLRLACLGDSWVCSWTDGEEKKIKADMPIALRNGMESRSENVELVVAGFPGATTERVLPLVQICRLRDMALMSEHGCSIKDDLVRRLEEQQIPFLADATNSATLNEDVDVVLLAVGSNDLCQEDLSQQVLGRLFKLRQIYIERGVDVLLVSLGGAGPEAAGQCWWSELEANRVCINSQLLKEDWVFNFDWLMDGLMVDKAMWADAWHLSKEGSSAYGDRLAAAVVDYLKNKRLKPPRKLPQSLQMTSDLVRVSRCNNSSVPDAIEGVYRMEGANHGRPVFKRQSKGGSADVVIFFRDDRWGPKFGGWWFGPEIGWDRPGWPRCQADSSSCEDTSGFALPSTGWKVPGAVDESLKISSVKMLQNGQDVTGAAKTDDANMGSDVCPEPPSKVRRQSDARGPT